MARDRERTETYRAAERFIRASGRHASAGDTTDLTALLRLQDELAIAIQATVDGLQAQGYSWQEIATASRMTKKGAWKRWAHGTYGA